MTIHNSLTENYHNNLYKNDNIYTKNINIITKGLSSENYTSLYYLNPYPVKLKIVDDNLHRLHFDK